jgi:hypothetical protein
MPETANTKICPHLQPFLTELTGQGSTVIQRDESAWSNCTLNVTLDKGPTFAQAENMFTLPAKVKLWQNTDTHYALENGLFCDECKHSLSWTK